MIRFRVGDCSVRVSFWFAAVCAFMLLLNDGSQLTLFCMLIHEGGHLFLMKLLGQPPQTVAFHAFGIDIGESGMGSYFKDAAVSLGGPMANLLSGVLTVSFWRSFGCLSLFLGGFHLLPIFYLDGGRALYSVLCAKKEAKQAERLTKTCSLLALIPLGIAAVAVLWQTRGNFSLLFIWAYLLFMLIFKNQRFF